MAFIAPHSCGGFLHFVDICGILFSKEEREVYIMKIYCLFNVPVTIFLYIFVMGYLVMSCVCWVTRREPRGFSKLFSKHAVIGSLLFFAVWFWHGDTFSSGPYENLFPVREEVVCSSYGSVWIRETSLAPVMDDAFHVLCMKSSARICGGFVVRVGGNDAAILSPFFNEGTGKAWSNFCNASLRFCFDLFAIGYEPYEFQHPDGYTARFDNFRVQYIPAMEELVTVPA